MQNSRRGPYQANSPHQISNRMSKEPSPQNLATHLILGESYRAPREVKGQARSQIQPLLKIRQSHIDPFCYCLALHCEKIQA